MGGTNRRRAILIFSTLAGLALGVLLFFFSGMGRKDIVAVPSVLARYLCANDPDWSQVKSSEFTAQQVVDYFYWTNASSCKLAHDFGGQMVLKPVRGLDGQKAVCLDPSVAPKPGNCLVYSFGINNEWSFDDMMEEYGCDVYSFDPTMGQSDHDRSKRIHFYNMGLGGQDSARQGMVINSLSTIYKKLKHEGRIIDYLKMDIEGAEWEALSQILATGMLAKVRQLAVEFHWPAENAPLDRYRSFVSLIKSMEDFGMTRFDSKANIFWTGHIVPLNYTGPLGFEIAWYQILPYSS